MYENSHNYLGHSRNFYATLRNYFAFCSNKTYEMAHTQSFSSLADRNFMGAMVTDYLVPSHFLPRITCSTPSANFFEHEMLFPARFSVRHENAHPQLFAVVVDDIVNISQ